MSPSSFQWLFLVPLIGGRYHIIPQLAVYTTYIPLIYCLLGDYISPTTYKGNQKQLLIILSTAVRLPETFLERPITEFLFEDEVWLDLRYTPVKHNVGF